MILQTRARSVKPRRRLPPGQRLLALLGILAVAGALAALIWQAARNEAQSLAPANSAGQAVAQSRLSGNLAAAQMPCPLLQPLTDVAQKISVAANQPKLRTGVFVVEPDTGKFIDIDSRRAFPAASMIKLPLLVSLLQAVDAGTVKLDQTMVVRADLKGGGSGCLQWRPDNSKLSLNDCAQLMMIISDNTATNMIIDLLGGAQKCNQQFGQWGLTRTRINNWLPDLTGTNTTSPYDLALLMSKIDHGSLISSASRSWMLQTLERNKIRTLLPMGVPAGTRIADKTGDIATLVGDVGIITTTSGQRYIAAVAVERPWNDRRANALIRQISKHVYAGITGDLAGISKLEAQQQAAAAPRRAARPSGRPHHRRRHG